ncbi:hypothetical protein [Enterocloster lavalensis]|uniref:hypothetical protein n=1 Tax=Enterocloster lavalensis TaxID=460384 RepID=UPI000D1B0C62|nr:hypothetical protein [Enterocloster lavalensis]PST31360.1 hypothetical protein C7256_20350 [Enterocloster lavalensis]
MKKENAEKLLGWAREAQRIFTESGETDFAELRRKEQNAILDGFISLGYPEDGDGDCDISYSWANVDNARVIFYGHSDCCMMYELRNHLTNMVILLDGIENDLEEFAAYLEYQLTAKTEIVNLTPHAITVYDAAGENVLQTIPSTGVARAEQRRDPIGKINGIPVSKSSYGAAEGLPAPKDGVVYIVSAITAQAAPDRDDLYITDELVRDDGGQILGCKALAQI